MSSNAGVVVNGIEFANNSQSLGGGQLSGD